MSDNESNASTVIARGPDDNMSIIWPSPPPVGNIRHTQENEKSIISHPLIYIFPVTLGVTRSISSVGMRITSELETDQAEI